MSTNHIHQSSRNDESTPLLSNKSMPTSSKTLYKNNNTVITKNYQIWQTTNQYYRFYVLLLITLIPIGGHVVKSSLGSLQPLLIHDKQWAHKLTHTQFGLFQSVVSVPNLIVPLIGGLWLDIRGSRTATLCALLLCVIGHTLFSISISLHSYIFALIARSIFGLGQGNTVVAQGRIAAKWFVGRELVLAVALTESTHNIANFIGAVYTVPVIHYTHNYIYALWFGVIICGLSLFSGIILFATTNESNTHNEQHGDILYHNLICHTCSISAHDTVYGIDQQYRRRVRLNSIECIEISSDLPSPRLSDLHESKHYTKHINYNNLSRISFNFLLLCLLHMLFSNVNHLFGYVLANMMATDWNYSLDASALLSGISSLIAIFLCPILGLVFDRYGYKMYACTIAGIVSAIAYLLLAYAKQSINPIIPLIMLALSMSYVPTVLRSAVPGLLPPVLYGTGYGLYSVAESIGAVIGHSFVGYVRDINNDYHYNLVIFAILAIIASCISIILSISNIGTDLNKPSLHHHHTHQSTILPHSTDRIINTADCPCLCHSDQHTNHNHT